MDEGAGAVGDRGRTGRARGAPAAGGPGTGFSCLPPADGRAADAGAWSGRVVTSGRTIGTGGCSEMARTILPQSAGGGSDPAPPSRAAISWCNFTSARQRGHSAKCAWTASRSPRPVECNA